MREAQTTKWPMFPVALLTVVFFINFLSRIILSPLVPAVEDDLGIGHGMVGSLFLCITAGYFVSLLGSGFISARLTHRATIILSASALGFVMLLVSVAGSAPAVAAGMFAIGLAAGFYLPSGIAAITDLLPPDRWGRALAVHELAPNLSFMLAPVVAEALMVFVPWRGVVAIIGLASLCAGAGFSRLRTVGAFRGRKPALRSALALFRNRRFVMISVLFALGIGSTIGVYAMLPLYLVSAHGLERTDANSLVAVSRFLSVLTVFLGGWAADRFGRMRTIRLVFLVTGSLTILLGALPAPWVCIAVVLQPVLAVCFFPAGFAVLSATVPAEHRNVAISLSIPSAFLIGAGLFPAVIGLMADARLFHAGFLLVGTLILSGSLLSLLAAVPEDASVTRRR